MNTTRLLRRLATPAFVGTGLAVVLGAGVASAYLTSNVAATGTGTATPLSDTTPLALAATGSVGTGLYPGGPGADVTITVTNPYGEPVDVTAVVAAGAITANPLPGRTCATHGVTLATPSAGLPATIPASGSDTVTLTAVATMSLTADSGCQGATFTIPFQVTGQL